MEERKAEMERLNEEAKQEKSKSGRREVEREGERVEIKRMCLNRVSSGFFENFSRIAEWESDGDSLGFSVCVPAVPLSEPDLTVPFCPVHGDCEVLCDSDCEIVEQQTRSLRKTRSVFWCEVRKT